MGCRKYDKYPVLLESVLYEFGKKSYGLCDAENSPFPLNKFSRDDSIVVRPSLSSSGPFHAAFFSGNNLIEEVHETIFKWSFLCRVLEKCSEATMAIIAWLAKATRGHDRCITITTGHVIPLHNLEKEHMQTFALESRNIGGILCQEVANGTYTLPIGCIRTGWLNQVV